MAQRTKKTSRRQTEVRRRWQDLKETNQQKDRGPWKRKDRRRAASQTIRQRLRMVQAYRACRAKGLDEATAAQQVRDRLFGQRDSQLSPAVGGESNHCAVASAAALGRRSDYGGVEKSGPLSDFRTGRLSDLQAASALVPDAASCQPPQGNCVSAGRGEGDQ